MAAFEFTDDKADKITEFVSIKQAPKVVKQMPAPGTPVIQGMTIEVHAVSYSDVPWVVLDPGAIPGIRNIPVAEIEKVIADDSVLRAAAATGTVVNETDFNARFSSGLAARGFQVGLTAGQGSALAKSFNQLGFR